MLWSKGKERFRPTMRWVKDKLPRSPTECRGKKLSRVKGAKEASVASGEVVRNRRQKQD